MRHETGRMETYYTRESSATPRRDDGGERRGRGPYCLSRKSPSSAASGVGLVCVRLSKEEGRGLALGPALALGLEDGFVLVLGPALALGPEDGFMLALGWDDGAALALGTALGTSLGTALGTAVGTVDGVSLGAELGAALGSRHVTSEAPNSRSWFDSHPSPSYSSHVTEGMPPLVMMYQLTLHWATREVSVSLRRA